MVSNSVSVALRRISQSYKKSFELGYLYVQEKGKVGRLLSSNAVGNEILEDESNSREQDGDLKSRIFRLRLPKRSAANVIERWVGEGNAVTASELRNITKELRRSLRFKHALEISEWLVTHKEFELSDSDYATRIDLMTKVFGIDAAERYFQGLPPAAQTTETFTALLHSYAAAKQIQKAEELYERIKQSDLSFTSLAYNEMMTLYMSVGQVEKVSAVVEELKRHKVALDIFTYNLWISSCAATLNIDEARRILGDMSQDPGSNDDWVRYVNIARIYLSAGHLVNAESIAVVGAGKGITQREWITYDFLIILHAGMGNKDKVDQIWKSLRLTKQRMTNRNYVCILASYLMLGHLKEVGEVIDQWNTEFDISACRRLLDAFSGVGLSGISDGFHILLIEKGCDPINAVNYTS